MDLEVLFAEPTHRRWWLLIKALECTSLDQAIDLARAADCFVLGEKSGKQAAAAATTASHSTVMEILEKPKVAQNHKSAPTTIKSPRLNLSDAERKALTDRISKGATNAELAAEFGPRPRQIDERVDKPMPPAANGHPLFWQTSGAEKL